MKSKFLLLVFVFLVLLFNCCKKDDSSNKIDYRTTYTGDFSFKVIDETWMGTDSIIYTTDTFFTVGGISLFRVNQLLIKYNSNHISGFWSSDTVNCSGLMIMGIDDTLINNPTPIIGNAFFIGYFNNWISPVFHMDSTLRFPCIPFRYSGGVHLAFGGYFINRDSLYLFYSDGGLGAGSYRYVYGKRILSNQ